MMKFSNIKQLFFLMLFITLSVNLNAQSNDIIWKKTTHFEKNESKKMDRRAKPKSFQIFDLNELKLKNELKKIAFKNTTKKIISFPNAKGELERFEITEASIFSKKLQQQYPEIKSYKGKSIDNKGGEIRFSISKRGMYGMVFNHNGEVHFIDPYTSDKKSYIIYNKKSLPSVKQFECLFDEEPQKNYASKNNKQAKIEDVNDGVLRTFRLAIATTGEYSQFFLTREGIDPNASEAEKKEVVLEAINTTMTRVNGIFERDLSVTMVLVDNNTDIIFLDPDTDGFTNNSAQDLIDESQSKIDEIIGFANYDIGHTFSTGGGGLAQVNSPCTGGKARGITGSSNPFGDYYDVDFVAHEMGHQFGAHHTFNGDEGGCSGNRNDGTAVEPGSGSTIMSYAGLCAPQNVDENVGAYFHLVSIREMWNNITNGTGTCSTNSSTGNNAPTIEALQNYAVPISTPFKLDVNANDANGDNLTYTWEQLDTEITNVPLASTATGGPAFRSLAPTTNSYRYFPKVETVRTGEFMNDWEVLPSVARTMRFGVTIRDNNQNGGQTTSGETFLTFVDSAGPFKITSQNTTENWDEGTSKEITWDVANTNNAPINCAFVNILLSTDGGLTFPITLASNVPNDGFHEIVVPSTTSNTVRIKVESVGNVFYDMNDVDITIQAAEFVMNFDSYAQEVCEPNNLVYTFTYNTFLGFSEETTFSVDNLPNGVVAQFSPTTAINNNTNVTLTISNINVNNIGNFDISVIGTSASTTKQTVVNAAIFSSTVNTPQLSFPLNNAVNVLLPYELSWDTDENAKKYLIQIATDENFTNIIEENSNLNINKYYPENLENNTLYFWRIKAFNSCGESNYSEVFAFKTSNEICETFNAEDLPKSIADNIEFGTNSKIVINRNLIITDININVSINHTYVSDLKLTLISPSGKSILLAAGLGDDGDNYTDTTFDYESEIPIQTSNPPFTGIFKPQGNLSTLYGENSFGEWTLNVVDSAAEDIGTINSWSIDICGASNDFFSVKTVSETCRGQNNGQIEIEVFSAFEATATLNGTNYTGTSNILINNLPPGNYDLCISIPEETYTQCYELTIQEGGSLSAKSTLKNKQIEVEILEGTPPFNVLKNGQLIRTTSNNFFSIDVTNGDSIEVKTAVGCEGSFFKQIEFLTEISVYPNPTFDFISVITPVENRNEIIDVYNQLGQLITSKKINSETNSIEINLSNQATGIYFVKLRNKNLKAFKIIKQ